MATYIDWGTTGGILKPARKLLVVFLSATLVPAGLAGWLSWRLLEQDRVLARERLRDIRERRADEVVQNLSRALAPLEQEARIADGLDAESPATSRPVGQVGAG